MCVRPRLLVASLFAIVPATFFACQPQDGVFINGHRMVPDAGFGWSFDSSQPPPYPGTYYDAGPSCDPDGGALCKGVCVDTQSDSTHCGGCGITCGSAQLCAAGTCVADVLTKLGFDVVDAEYSRSLDRIVAVSASPMALHIYDPGAKTDVVIALPKAPTSVSVGPDGHHAAVGHDAFLSYVDLDAQKTLGTFAVSDPIGDVVLAGNGGAYAFPTSTQSFSGSVHRIDVTTGADTKESSGFYSQANVELHPNLRSLYGVDRGSSPGSFVKYDISDGGLTQSGQFFGSTYDPCGNLWIAKDGLRIYTACGYVFRASDDKTQDMQYAGSLETTQQRQRVASVDDTSVSVAAIFGNAPYYGYGQFSGDDTLVTFDGQYLAQKSTRAMPRYAAGTRSFATSGRFVFFRADGTSLVAIVQVDPASNAAQPFALATF